VVTSPELRQRAAEADLLMRGVNSPDLRAPSVDSIAYRSLHSTHSAPAGSLHSASVGPGSNNNTVLHNHSAKTAFSACRPIATPFRPSAESLSAMSGLHGPTAHSSSAGNLNTSILKNSVAHLQDCYADHSKGAKPKKNKNTLSTGLSRSYDADDQGYNNNQGGRATGIPVGNLSELNSRPLSPMTVESADLGASTELPPPNDDAERTRAVTFGHSTELSLGTNEKRGKKAPSKGDAGGKSIFVGSGLGLKHNAKLDAELKNLNKGSTQQILKKILGDRFD
jgi:hypothetical protein